MKLGTVAGLTVAVLLAISTNAHALWWPWQQRHYHYHRHAPRQATRAKPPLAAPPNCDQINAEVRKLPAERYERAMRSLSKVEQRIVMQCEVQP